MTDNVVVLDCITRLNIPPDRVLEMAINKLEGVVLIGYDKEGREYFSSSYADGGDTLWLLERCKMNLLKIVEE